MAESPKHPHGALARVANGAGRFWKHVSLHPLWSALLAGLLILVGGAVLAWLTSGNDDARELPIGGWGPPRPVYWCKAPKSCDGADHVVFNSYANAPNYGDERAFVDAKSDRNRSAGGFHDVLEVHAGETVLVRLYINNAAWVGRLGRSNGLAVGTEARVALPLEPSTQHVLTGYVSARNALPRVVWDGVTLQSGEATVLRFVFESARWWTWHLGEPVPVSDAVIEEGASIGSWALDGRFGDSFADSGLLTFLVRVEDGSIADSGTGAEPATAQVG